MREKKGGVGEKREGGGGGDSVCSKKFMNPRKYSKFTHDNHDGLDRAGVIKYS